MHFALLFKQKAANKVAKTFIKKQEKSNKLWYPIDTQLAHQYTRVKLAHTQRQRQKQRQRQRQRHAPDTHTAQKHSKLCDIYI